MTPTTHSGRLTGPMSCRLVRLHLGSRRTPLAAGILLATAAGLRAVQPWTDGTGEAAGLLPLIAAAAVAAAITVGTRSPFGEPERATHPLPLLRLLHIAALLPAAAALLAAARLGHDPLAAARNAAGLTGLALLTAPLLGASLAWIPPLAYVIYCGGPLDVHQVTLWSWPGLPGTHLTATAPALVLLAAGLTATVLAGPADHRTDPT